MWSADPKVPFWLPLTVRQHRLSVHRGFAGYFEDLRTTFVTLKSQRYNGGRLRYIFVPKRKWQHLDFPAVD
jgi:hypothetical protein